MAQVSKRRRTEAPRSNSEVQPLLRIAKVSVLTGVPQPTLRAWERRYGIPKPHRSEGGYRLYGNDEVVRVMAMRALCDQGTPASEAARRVQQGEGATSAAATKENDLDPMLARRTAILEAVERLDDAAMEFELRRVLFLGHPLEILEGVLRPVLRVVGDQWHEGVLSVAHEHFASQKIGTLIRDLVALTTDPASTAKVVLASFADDEHELGLLGVALKFASWGMRPVVLGARTPPDALAAAIVLTRPALVALSLTSVPDRKRVRDQLHAYAKACAGVPWLVGGLSAPKVAPLVVTLGGIVEPQDVKLRAIVRAKIKAFRAR